MSYETGWVKIPSPYITKVVVRAAELSNKKIYALQIGAALFDYKLGKTLLQIGAASLLQIGARFVTNWGSYYKLGQRLLQNRAAITNWSNTYYKTRQVLQIRTIVTNWVITYCKYAKRDTYS